MEPLGEESWTPAPYGGACVGCSRAKCKCFYRKGDAVCERCHRLKKMCEPSVAVRKPKAQPKSTRKHAAEDSHGPGDERGGPASLSHSHVVDQTAHSSDNTVPVLSNSNTPSNLDAHLVYGSSAPSTPAHGTEVVLDTAEGFLDFVQPGSTALGSSNSVSALIASDILAHPLSDIDAEFRLNLFRVNFLSYFPFVYIPPTTNAVRLRQEKPFLWLVVMALTEKRAAKQFEMEETMWKIISGRVVAGHHMSLDLLLGIVGFSAWSHYFKKDKPYMNMLTQIAITLAYDLQLDKAHSTSVESKRYAKKTRGSSQHHSMPELRTLEERRTFVALFHVSSITWEAYRKITPLGSSSYLRECVRILGDGQETSLDRVLALQVNCQMLTNRVICPDGDEVESGEATQAPPRTLCTAILRQLEGIRESLPAEMHSTRNVQFCLHSAEIKVRDRLLNGRLRHDPVSRLRDLESALGCVERWLMLLADIQMAEWIGISVESFNQFMQCLILLFKLTNLDEPGWDTAEVRRRADVIGLIDQYCNIIEQIPAANGLVDTGTLRHGLFFKAPHLFRAVKTLMLEQLSPDKKVPNEKAFTSFAGYNEGAPVADGDSSLVNGFLMNLDYEPWLADLFDASWDLGMDRLQEVAY